MAYKKAEIEKLALAAIEKYRPITVEELIAYIPISESTFYKWKLQELQCIKDAMHHSKVEIKAGLRQKWYKGSSHATQIALYKLLASPSELEALNGRTPELNTIVANVSSAPKITWTKKKDDNSKS